MSGNEARTFAAMVVPPLQIHDLPEFMNTVARYGSAPAARIGSLGVLDVISTIRHLGIHGKREQARILAAFLHHQDSAVAAAAEESLWMLWMQAGSVRGNELLRDAVALIERDEWLQALAVLELAINEEPEFAELHHQRGIVLSMQEDHALAAESFAEALRLNPHHFAAAAGLGHACVELGRWPDANRAYAEAVNINPNLHEIATARSQLGRALGIEA